MTVDLQGSDLHLAINTPPQVRVHGKLQRLDMLYMTRVQKERFDDVSLYERVKKPPAGACRRGARKKKPTNFCGRNSFAGRDK